LARFEREAETMTSLRHPNLVQLFGHGRRGALPYIVMEFLEGLTLTEAMEKTGPIGVAETVAVARHVAAGLTFLHEHGLVHRDIKPQNVVLGATGKVTILDLGVVRDQANPGLTRPGAMVGTPYYMSPEQIYGVDDIDRRTDVYALAAMTFELLTGRPPFLGNNNFEVLYGHKTVAPPDASTLVKSIPRGVAQALIRGMAKKREERPATATDFVAELEAHAGARRVDLAKAFAAALQPFTEQRTRVMRAPTPSLTPADGSNADLPMVAEEDVQSAPNRLGDGEAKTVLLDTATLAEVRKAIAQRDAQRRAAAARQPAAPASTTGELAIEVRANGKAVRANVTVDGINRGGSPVSLLLTAGTHVVRIDLAGFRSVEKLVDVPAGGALPVTMMLREK
jgi:serine/threonine protein kinase